MISIEENGAPGGIRTPDLLVRSQTLYPAELRARRNADSVPLDYDTAVSTSTALSGNFIVAISPGLRRNSSALSSVTIQPLGAEARRRFRSGLGLV